MYFLSTTFPNAPPPPLPPAILFDQSLMVFCSIRFRWSPWLFSLINMLSSLARIANRFWGMNKASLLINSIPPFHSDVAFVYCDLFFRKISALRNQNDNIYFISFNYFETPEIVVISQKYSVKGLKQCRWSSATWSTHSPLYFLEYHVELKIVYSLWI